jgi:hypothetical protein
MRDARLVRDQVLAHLDQRMRKPAFGAVGLHRVAFERAGIGLVVADNPARLRAHGGEQGPRETVVAIPKDRGLPLAGHAFPDWREGMDGDERRRMAGGDGGIDRSGDDGVIGRVIGGRALRDLGRSRAAITGNDRAVRHLHHQGRVVRTAIEIDEKPRPAPEQGRRAE